MGLKHNKTVASIAMLLTIIVVVAYRLESQQRTSFAIKWEGWRYARVVVKERDFYIADTNYVAQRFRSLQLGPVRILRGPVEP